MLQPSTAKLRKSIVRLLLSVASLVIVLAALELALRVHHNIHQRREGQAATGTSGWFPASNLSEWENSGRSDLVLQPSSIPGLDYDLAPNRELRASDGILIRTNQFGMRDSEPSAQSTRSPCRVAVLGDSFTFGWKVDADQAYPKVLERRLRGSSVGAACQFEVLNFAVPGYSSRDEALMLRYRAVNFDPRLVIVGYVLNDPEIDPLRSLNHFFREPEWWQHFRLLQLVARTKSDWDQKRLGGGDYYVYLHAQQKKWQSVVDAFSDIHQVTSARNIKVLVVIFPEITTRFKGKPWSAYPYLKIHRQVSELAVKNGFRVLDLLKAFSEYPSQDVVFLANDDHPSVLGHEVAARAIEKELLAESSIL